MGVAQIQSGIGNLTFRNDPNSIEWEYNLVTHQEDTYGGRVIQLLGVNISAITVAAEAGSGGVDYRRNVALFFRDLLIHQRDTAAPAIFTYPTRRFSFKVYVLSFQMAPSLTEQPSRPFTIQFQAVEELTNIVTKSIMSAELKKLNEGVGWTVSQYSDVTYKPKSTTKPPAYGPSDPNFSGYLPGTSYPANPDH